MRSCMNHLAYVFERFPSFTQTFCVREILELERQGLKPLIFSIHDVSDEEVNHFPPDLVRRVHVLPPEKQLVEAVQRLKDERKLPQSIVLTLREWGDLPDKMRVYEAAYIGHEMEKAGVRHAHTHFAGIGARTCWWLRQFHEFTYSFTGHANDIFVDPKLPVTLRHLMDGAAMVATVSDFTADWLRKQYPAAASKVHRVYNGLDLDAITNSVSGAAKLSPPLIFSVGRLIEKKGFDDLIHSCALLRDAGIDFQCALAGDGPMQEELTALINEYQLAGKVTLLGAQSQDQIKQWLAGTTIFALPCVTEKDGGRDNLPTVLMEAMAAVLPCASTRLAGVPEMVVHEETGLLCEERHPKEFARLLERLLKDPKVCQRYGQAGLARARNLFAQEKTAHQLMLLQIQFGNIARDENLIQRHPDLAGAYAKQWLPKLKRWFHHRFHHRKKQAIKP